VRGGQGGWKCRVRVMPRLWWRVRNKHRSHEECGRNWWRMCIMYVVVVLCVKRPSSSRSQGCERERCARGASRTRLIVRPPPRRCMDRAPPRLRPCSQSREPTLLRSPRPRSQIRIQARSISLSPRGSLRDRPFDRGQSSCPCLCVMQRCSQYGTWWCQRARSGVCGA
jgi:hypothetical protein